MFSTTFYVVLGVGMVIVIVGICVWYRREVQAGSRSLARFLLRCCRRNQPSAGHVNLAILPTFNSGMRNAISYGMPSSFVNASQGSVVPPAPYDDISNVPGVPVVPMPTGYDRFVTPNTRQNDHTLGVFGAWSDGDSMSAGPESENSLSSFIGLNGHSFQRVGNVTFRRLDRNYPIRLEHSRILGA